MTTRGRTLLALAAALGGAAAPGAASAAPLPEASYGGGFLPGPYGFTRGYSPLTVAGATTGSDANAVRIRVAVVTRCRGGSWVNMEMAGTGSVAADGHLRLSLATRSIGVPGDPIGAIRGRGTLDVVFDGANATGVATVTADDRYRGRRFRCNSGRRTFFLRAARPSSDPGAVPAGGTVLYGPTSGFWRGAPTQALLRVSKDRAKVSVALLGMPIGCQGATELLSNLSPPMTIRADGTFAKSETYRIRFSNATDTYRVRVAGRFTATGVSGTFTASSTTRNRAGRVLYRCSTGSLAYSATS